MGSWWCLLHRWILSIFYTTHQKLSLAWRMTPKASASFAVEEMFNICLISLLDVRRNGLHAFSSLRVVGILCTRKKVTLRKSTRRLDNIFLAFKKKMYFQKWQINIIIFVNNNKMTCFDDQIIPQKHVRKNKTNKHDKDLSFLKKWKYMLNSRINAKLRE